MALVGQTLTVRSQNESYLLLSKVGAGATAEVFCARLVGASPEVLRAIKVMRPGLTAEIKDRFQEEIVTLRKWEEPAETLALVLNGVHPIPHVYWMEEIPEPFIVEELVEGESVLDLVKRNGGCLPEEQALQISHQFSTVLLMLHTQLKMTYQDMKLDNIRWDGTGIKVLDWNVVGKDQEQQELEKGVAQDLLRFGAFMYQLVTGKVLTLRDGHRQEPLRVAGRWKNLSFGFREILEKVLHNNPAKRYPTSGDLMQALAGYQALFSLKADRLEETGMDLLNREQFVEALRYLDLAAHKRRWVEGREAVSKSLQDLIEHTTERVSADLEGNLSAGERFFVAGDCSKALGHFDTARKIDDEDLRIYRWQAVAQSGLESEEALDARKPDLVTALHDMADDNFENSSAILASVKDVKLLGPIAQRQLNRVWTEAQVRVLIAKADQAKQVDKHGEAGLSYREAARILADAFPADKSDPYANLLLLEFGDLWSKSSEETARVQARVSATKDLPAAKEFVDRKQWDEARMLLAKILKDDPENREAQLIALDAGQELLEEVGGATTAEAFFFLLQDKEFLGVRASKGLQISAERENIERAFESGFGQDIAQTQTLQLVLAQLAQLNPEERWVSAMRAKASKKMQEQWQIELQALIAAGKFSDARKRIEDLEVRFGQWKEWESWLPQLYQKTLREELRDTLALGDVRTAEAMLEQVRARLPRPDAEAWAVFLQRAENDVARVKEARDRHYADVLAKAKDLVNLGTRTGYLQAQELLANEKGLTEPSAPGAELYRQVSDTLKPFLNLWTRFLAARDQKVDEGDELGGVKRASEILEEIKKLKPETGPGIKGLDKPDNFDELRQDLILQVNEVAQILLDRAEVKAGAGNIEDAHKLRTLALKLDPNAQFIHNTLEQAERVRHETGESRNDYPTAAYEASLALALDKYRLVLEKYPIKRLKDIVDRLNSEHQDLCLRWKTSLIESAERRIRWGVPLGEDTAPLHLLESAERIHLDDSDTEKALSRRIDASKKELADSIETWSLSIENSLKKAEEEYEKGATDEAKRYLAKVDDLVRPPREWPRDGLVRYSAVKTKLDAACAFLEGVRQLCQEGITALNMNEKNMGGTLDQIKKLYEYWEHNALPMSYLDLGLNQNLESLHVETTKLLQTDREETPTYAGWIDRIGEFDRFRKPGRAHQEGITPHSQALGV